MKAAEVSGEAEELLNCYSDMVLRIALHNVKARADAEDIAQEVFLKRVTARRSFASPEHEKAWMIRVTVNQCRDFLKSARNRPTVALEESVPDSPHSTEVLDAVLCLPVLYRNVIYLYYYEGYSVREISRILRRRENTVSSWLFRARAALKNSLTGGFDDES
ncbi:sigma-70 family RNA polymerase sigma factor [Caproicibacter sp.]|uniref:sigma-70 family RNA polymerase sigma factor n=1 Tax=Caproicibacter sp. TaxID=2814884 RepID=UPI003988F9DE